MILPHDVLNCVLHDVLNDIRWCNQWSSTSLATGCSVTCKVLTEPVCCTVHVRSKHTCLLNVAKSITFKWFKQREAQLSDSTIVWIARKSTIKVFPTPFWSLHTVKLINLVVLVVQ